MLIRLSPWGLALLAASSLSSISAVHAQDADSLAEPVTPPAAVQLDESPEAAAHRAREAKEAEIEDRVIKKNQRRMDGPKKVHDADPWKKHPPIWSVRDETKTVHPYARPSAPAPGIGRFPGGPTGQFGYPYYYTAMTRDTAYPGMAPAYGAIPAIPPTISGGPGYGPPPMAPGYGGGYGAGYGSAVGGGYDPGYGAGGYGSGMSGYGPSYAGGDGGVLPPAGPAGYGPGYAGGYGGGFGGGVGPAYGAGFGGPGIGGGYGPMPPGPMMAAVPGQLPGNPYLYHFGPGFYRFQEAGHYSFPYYSYRRPWYFPGHPSYNRDTNIPW